MQVTPMFLCGQFVVSGGGDCAAAATVLKLAPMPQNLYVGSVDIFYKISSVFISFCTCTYEESPRGSASGCTTCLFLGNFLCLS